MLSSVEHEIFLLINVKVPTIVGILTFMSQKNSLLGLAEPEKSWISRYFQTYEHLQYHAQLSWACNFFHNLGARAKSENTIAIFTIFCPELPALCYILIYNILIEICAYSYFLHTAEWYFKLANDI